MTNVVFIRSIYYNICILIFKNIFLGNKLSGNFKGGFYFQIHIKDLLVQNCHIDTDEYIDVIVYDQVTENPSRLTEDNFLAILLSKLSMAFNRVALLRGKWQLIVLYATIKTSRHCFTWGIYFQGSTVSSCTLWAIIKMSFQKVFILLKRFTPVKQYSREQTPSKHFPLFDDLPAEQYNDFESASSFNSTYRTLLL